VPIPDSVLINPRIEFFSEDIVSDYEGCLSAGELMGKVPRSSTIRYSGYDDHGNYLTKDASGLEACIIQHEVVHLYGILFVDRIIDTKSMALYSEMAGRMNGC
jgi:peptide deformylase